MTENGNNNDAGSRKLKVSCHSCLQKLDVSELKAFAHVKCPACGADIIVPEWFGPYLLEELWGIGGMAKVYRSLDPTLDREVAIKILEPQISELKEVSECFLNEGRIAANINHPSVVPIYSCGNVNGRPYLIMQFMEHGSLESLLKREKKFAVKQVLEWGSKVAAGLRAAQRMQIDHHDVKTANILLDVDGNVKIGDFGLANAISDARSEKLMEITGSWGSPDYVSPEKLSGGKEYYRSDIFSLGITFYELLTGVLPFDRKGSSDTALEARLQKKFTPPAKIRPDIPPDIDALICKMLEPKPENRPEYDQIIAAFVAAHKKVAALEQDAGRDKKPGGGFSTKVKLFAAAAILLIVFSLVWAVFDRGGKTSVKDGVAAEAVAKRAMGLLAAGKSRVAYDAAMRNFENVKLNQAVRTRAALLTAFAACLNLDETAADSCAMLSERLKAAGVKEREPVIEILTFLAKPDIQDAYLTKIVNVSPLDRQLAAVAIFLRAAYLDEPKKQLLKKLSALESMIKKYPDTWVAGVWAKRLPLYRAALSKGLYNGNEPALKRIARKSTKNKKNKTQTKLFF